MEENELTRMVQRHLEEMYDMGRKDMKESILTGLKDIQFCLSPEGQCALEII